MLAHDWSQLLRISFAPPVDPCDSADFDDGYDESDECPKPEELDDDRSLELDDEYWEALLLDDDYEPQPDDGDFWIDQDAA